MVNVSTSARDTAGTLAQRAAIGDLTDAERAALAHLLAELRRWLDHEDGTVADVAYSYGRLAALADAER